MSDSQAATSGQTPAQPAAQPAEQSPEQYVLTLSCPDKQGIVHAVSSYLFMTGCNIEDSQQFGDHDTGLFFMRVHFSGDVTLEKLRASFAAIGDSFRMDWQIHRADERMRPSPATMQRSTSRSRGVSDSTSRSLSVRCLR
ncbi:ACT domain-containing protein, partial [Streptomyces sp. NPDC048845]|uniref:ACT domain-containing protein n=1 Tax=Streptomyces sp. NPDC048845 TaxID=3155390 RepID=UPI003423B0CE